ncbi:MAG: di-heme oxidoredictase family protein [Actinomycetota bacterium]
MPSPCRAVADRVARVGVSLLTVALIVAACSGGDAGSVAPAPTGPPTTTTVAAVPDAVVSEEPPSWLIERAGDATTTFEVSDRSYNLSARNLGLTARIRFADGDEIFEARFDDDTGLGPDFNANSCTSCHVNNGRHARTIDPGYVGIGPVVHVSAEGADDGDAPLSLPGYGTRFQTYAVGGNEAEAQVNVLYDYTEGAYPDGTPYELRRPIVSVIGREGMLPADAQLSLRIPPPVAGPGLLEYVPEADIVAAADPDDSDGDGISGEVQWVTVDGETRLGRHGWKAETPDLVRQSAGALAEDMGIGTSVHPVAGSVEVNDDDLADLAFYVEGLAIPAGRDIDDPDVIRGANLFDTVGCTSCHTPQQRTGTTQVPELDDLVIIPFTDLLLHDMGPGLADDRPVFNASGQEWRTAPLWGIGLLEIVNGHVSLLHDGRARSIEEAILWHGGEAQGVTDTFMALSAADRASLIRFVESR